MNNLGRNLALWISIILVLLLFVNMFHPSSNHHVAKKLTYSDFITDVDKGDVRSAMIQNRNVSGVLKNGTSFETYTPLDPSLVPRMVGKGVEVSAKPVDQDGNPILRYFLNSLPIILLIAAWLFMMRQMQGAGGRAMGFGKSRAKMLTEKQGRVTFKDVAGIDEAKGELQEIVDFLKDPQKFTRLGGKIPKGVLLVGPPGTGKTLLARAIAGEADVPFFTISGSDFVEMFVGVGASRVRDMFEQGKKAAPCIIFIDEIDAVGRHRGAGMGGGNDEREQTLNQMLVEMDGFESSEGVILVAATNRPDVLDQALLRPGRFDRQVTVPNPDVTGREKILRVHMRKVPLASNVDPKIIARGTPGFSGADLANLVNEAALAAARENARSVSMQAFEEAKDKVLMGSERRSLVMSDKEKKRTAYHEAGHAVTAVLVPESEPIHKATIIPRGQALGMVMRLPEADRLSMSRNNAIAHLVVAMGGRVAEEVIYGKDNICTGAMGDIRMATKVARSMVTEWGMSPKCGLVDYADEKDQSAFGGTRSYSEQTARDIDEEVKRLTDEAYKQATQYLRDHEEQLRAVGEALLQYETLTGEEIRQVVRGEKIERSEDLDDSPVNRRGSVPRADYQSDVPDFGGAVPQPG